MRGARLRGARLRGARLRGARLRGAQGARCAGRAVRADQGQTNRSRANARALIWRSPPVSATEG
ncbi:pentapeptide repeat-containing protein [Phytohabitans aurantiacus]|uniref:pentapeptide repeat-containing protein n=1 Tax=Phytohabitans aurantiacus TaxID=3016789 RepID=UPI00389A9286